MSEGIHYYVLDTETSGLKVGYQDLLEISIVRCSDRTQLTRHIRALNPRNASVDALRITGKTMNDLYQGVSQPEAIDAVDAFFRQDGLTPAHRCVIAHNSPFDRKFLHHMWEQHGRSFEADLWLDTIPFSKRLAASMGQPKAKTNLNAAMDLFGLKKVAGAHTAKGDSRNTYLLWKHLMESNIEYIDLIKQFPHRKIEEVDDEDVEDLMAE
jgi:DNA polymerase III alpha subunit (gram-positive type)